MTSPDNSDKQKKLKNGVNECCKFIEIHATHCALLNGLLLWADIQRQTTPENIWKTQAITKFVSGEITEAKEILWRISGESILGKMVKRQEAAKSQSEINEICAALKMLSEKDCMPMFLSTSNMVSQMPIYKKVKQNQLECTSQLVANGNTWADIVGENAKPLDTKITEENIGDNRWTNVSSKNQKKKTWRQRLNTLRGTATSESDGEVLSADIHLVAFGVAKRVSGIQLSHFLEGKALHVLSCDLLTKYEGAQSLSYKVMIKSCDFDKAKNPELWPYRVGVRLFKFFNARNERKDMC